MKKLSMNDLTKKEEDNTYQPFLNDTSDIPTDEISMKAISELFDKKKLKTNSRIKFEQVQILSKLYMFSDIFGDSFTKKLADYILQLQISTSGLGRREIVQLVQQRNMMSEIVQPIQKSKDIFR